MNSNPYIWQVILCLLTLAAIYVALARPGIRRSRRMLLLLCPVVYGAVYYLQTKEPGGIYAILMCVVAELFVTFRSERNDKGDTAEP